MKNLNLEQIKNLEFESAEWYAHTHKENLVRHKDAESYAVEYSDFACECARDWHRDAYLLYGDEIRKSAKEGALKAYKEIMDN